MSTLRVAALSGAFMLFFGEVFGAPYVDPAVVGKVQKDSTARVIIDVRTPATGGHASAQATILQVLGDTEQKPTVLNSSAFAARVDHVGLKKLAESDHIVGVYIDKPAFPTIRDTAQITAAVLQWQAGHDGKDAVIAILDTGIDSDHPFLKPKIVEQACFSLHDPGRKIKSLCPKGFFAGESEVDLGDKAATGCALKDSMCAHGSHVAGIAAGVDLADPDAKDSRLAGIARGAGIFPIQVFSSIDDPSECAYGATHCVGAYTSAQIRALEYIRSKVLNRKATDQGPNIVAVNMSLGSGKYPVACDRESPLTRYIKSLLDEGVPTFVAAGNDGFFDGISMPACVSYAVAVGALDKPAVPGGALQYASYSNRFGDQLISLLAIGTNVRSSVPGGGYASMRGTSMATPVVAGAYAILKGAFPAASADEIIAAMKSTGQPILDPYTRKTRPAVNVDRAYRMLAGTPLPSNDQAVVVAGALAETPADPLGAMRFIIELPEAKGSESVTNIQSSSGVLAQTLNVEWVKASKLTGEMVSISVPSPVNRDALGAQLKKILGTDINIFVDRPAQPLGR